MFSGARFFTAIVCGESARTIFPLAVSPVCEPFVDEYRLAD